MLLLLVMFDERVQCRIVYRDCAPVNETAQVAPPHVTHPDEQHAVQCLLNNPSLIRLHVNDVIRSLCAIVI